MAVAGLEDKHSMKLETFVPDPRLMDWPLWDSIPWELQPFFVYDDLFGKPTVINEGRNEYEDEKYTNP